MNIRLKNTKAYISSFMKDTLRYYRDFVKNKSIQRSYGNYVLNATGNLTGSFKVVEQDKGKESSTSTLSAAKYIEELDKGRKAGAVNIDALIEWINRKPVTIDSSRVKGINREQQVRSLAHMISNSKKIKPTKGLNFLQEMYENRYSEILKGIVDPAVGDVELNIDQILLSAGYKKKGNQYTIEVVK